MSFCVAGTRYWGELGSCPTPLGSIFVVWPTVACGDRSSLPWETTHWHFATHVLFRIATLSKVTTYILILSASHFYSSTPQSMNGSISRISARRSYWLSPTTIQPSKDVSAKDRDPYYLLANEYYPIVRNPSHGLWIGWHRWEDKGSRKHRS